MTRLIGVLWTIASWWFIASVFAAPLFLAVRAARARSKRLFVDEPTARVLSLHRYTGADHYEDAL